MASSLLGPVVSTSAGMSAGGLAAAAAGGPPGWLLAALGLLPTLAGAFTPDPQERTRDELRRLASPEYLEELRRQIARRMGSSPSVMAGRRGIVESGSALTNMLQRSFGARGLGTSGIAAAAMPISNTATAGRLGQFETELASSSLNEAQNLISRQISALSGVPYGQSNFQAGLGKSFEAFLPLLQSWLKQRYPGVK